MSNDPIGTISPITDADLAAFRVNHALDSHEEKIVRNAGPGEFIIESRICFEVFSFYAPEVGDIVFDVRGIKDALADRKLDFAMYDITMVDHWVKHIREHNGVEVARMKQLTAADLERPAIALYWPKIGYTTVIDGNNRLVRRWDDGLRTVRLATIHVGRPLLPYICRPGEEEIFMHRRADEDPRDMVTLASKRIGFIGGLE